MNQLMVQADGGGFRLCGVEGGSLFEVWRGGKVQVDCGGRPFEEGGALVACLVGGLVISSFSFM